MITFKPADVLKLLIGRVLVATWPTTACVEGGGIAGRIIKAHWDVAKGVFVVDVEDADYAPPTATVTVR